MGSIGLSFSLGLRGISRSILCIFLNGFLLSSFALEERSRTGLRALTGNALRVRLFLGHAGNFTTEDIKTPSRSLLRRTTSAPSGLSDAAREQQATEKKTEKDDGTRMEEFLKTRPTKEEILVAASHQEIFHIGSVNAIPKQKCGGIPMAEIYSPSEAMKRFNLRRAPCLNNIQEILKDYQSFVTDHNLTMQNLRDQLLQKSPKTFRLGLIQWNSLNLKPQTLPLLAVFLDQENGFSADDVDGVVILLQENLKLSPDRQAMFLSNVQYVLNILSSNPNWGEATITYLNNVIGTQAKQFLHPSTQSIVVVMRTTHTPSEVCAAGHAILKREKGFIGKALSIPGMGKLAIMGAHLKGWDAKQLEELFPFFIKKCGKYLLGLDSFDLGLIMAADWNEHFHKEALTSLYEILQADRTIYPDFPRNTVLPSTTASNLKMTDLVTQALTQHMEKVEKYDPLFWAADRLGRMVQVQGAPKTLPAALKERGFSIISKCYNPGISYKWKSGCPYPKEKPQPGYSPFSVLKSQCLHPKVFKSDRGAGYLDRAAVRLHSASSLIIKQHLDKTAPSTLLPKTFASILKGTQVYNVASDHIMLGYIIEFLKI